MFLLVSRDDQDHSLSIFHREKETRYVFTSITNETVMVDTTNSCSMSGSTGEYDMMAPRGDNAI